MAVRSMLWESVNYSLDGSSVCQEFSSWIVLALQYRIDQGVGLFHRILKPEGRHGPRRASHWSKSRWTGARTCAFRDRAMNHEDIVRVLRGGDRASLVVPVRWSSAYGEYPHCFPRAIDCMQHEDEFVRMRVADAADKLAQVSSMFPAILYGTITHATG